ncbi:hypothetical protein [Lentzea sp. NPDC051838]
MRAFKIIAAALLVAAVAALTGPAAGQDREHILGSEVETLREHIL